MRTVAGVGGVGILCALAWQTAAHLPHWRGSVALFRHAIEVDPRNAGARFSLAKVYRAQDQTQEALGQITVILSDLPSSARAHNAMGMIRRDLGEFDAAAYHLHQAIEINPSLSLAYRNLGRVERDRGDSDAAEQAYRRSLELDPTGLRAQLSLARLLREQHRMEEAVSIYQGILREQPDLIAALNGVARAREEQGALAEAIHSYRRLTELRPADRSARERLRALERRATGMELTPPR
jgi:tetratricopeptide (TPR) repeat protein